MLQIRPVQMHLFEAVSWRRFEDDLIAHAQKFATRLCEVLGAERLRGVVQLALERSRAHGFTLRGPIRTYLELMLLFGSSFEDDPQHPWAGAALSSREDQMLRAQRLFEHAAAYQTAVAGPRAANVRRALAGIAELARGPLPFTEAGFEAEILAELRRLFPERAEYTGPEGLRALVAEGRAVARRFALPSPNGDALLVVLGFAFGHGCCDDPLYPWIGATLREERVQDPTVRATRLEKKALTWLDHVLKRLAVEARA